MLLVLVLNLAYSIEIPIYSAEGEKFSENEILKLNANDYIFSTSAYDFNYIKGSVGGQNVNFMLDFRNDESRIVLSECSCGSINKYNPKQSSSSKLLSGSSTEYDNMGYTYRVYEDSMSLGSLTADNQYFYGIKESDYYIFDSISGFLGLGNRNKNNKNQNFIKNLKAQNQISNEIFSLSMNDYSAPKQNSVLVLGDYDFEKYSSGQRKTISLDPNLEGWAIQISDLKYNSNKKEKGPFDAEFNPAYTSLRFPGKYYYAFERSLPSELRCGIMTCSCKSEDDILKFSDLYFTLNGHEIKIPKQNYVKFVNGYCKLGVGPTYLSKFIIGTPFFNSYYTVFNMSSHQLYFAPSILQVKESSQSTLFVSSSTLGIIGIAGLVLVSLKYKLSKRNSAESYQLLSKE